MTHYTRYLYSAEGELPEYVDLQEVEGSLRWVPSTRGNRVRVDIILIVDGKAVDLNRIPLPSNTRIIDTRFNELLSGIEGEGVAPDASHAEESAPQTRNQ